MAVTRAQFEAAAKKVMETAPPGLSKEKFLDLVHQQITQGSSTEIPLLQMRSHLNEQETPKEPDTYAGGFIKGLKDYYGPKLGLETGTGNKPGGALRETMESAAMPETLPEMAQSLIPAVPPILGRYASAIREGVEAAPSPLRVPQSVLKVLKDRVGEGVRLDLGVRRYLPSKSGVPDGGVPQGEMPTSSAVEVDRYMPSQSGYEGPESGASSKKVPYASPSEPVNTSPIPSGDIDEMLQELMSKDTPVDSRITGVPPEATTAGEGPLKQSGKFGKSGSLGQPGGYSSGRPSISAEDYAAMGTDTREGEMLNAPLETTPVDAAAATANVEMTPQQRVLEEQRQLAKTGGEASLRTDTAAVPGSGESPVSDGGGLPSSKPKLSVEEMAAMMRRMYGSRDAGKMIYGSSLPASERAESVTRLAPGPSQTPIVAEQRIQAARGKAATGDDNLLQELLKNLFGPQE